MRNRALHDALRDFAIEAAALLTRDLREGAELPFEVEEEPGGGATLYRYRPLTGRFIGERWAALRALPTCDRAAEALGTGARSYLRLRGAPGVDAEPALRAMLERLYEDATDFPFPEARFERVYGEVERTLYEDVAVATVLAPVVGLRLERPRVELGDGLALATGDAIDAPADAVWPRPVEGGAGRREPNALCVLEHALEAGADLPVTEARVRFRRLLGGLRLFKAGGLALGPLAWGRADEGAWRPFALGPTGHARGKPWVLAGAEEDELREFLAVVEDGRPAGPVAWALARFEMGAERPLETEGLSDYLLALRALLDGGTAGEASLTLRLAALCADERDRRAVQRRVATALSLERFVIGRGEADGRAYIDEIGSESPRALVLELEGHLRALLRDVLCGYLDSDLKAAADDILLESGEPIEIRARDLRRARGRQASEREVEAGELGAPGPADGPEPGGGLAGAAEASAAGVVEAEPTEPAEPGLAAEGERAEPARTAADRSGNGSAPPEHAAEGWRDAVTPSPDWALDEEPSGYSAPV